MAEEIWICEEGKVEKWESGDILEYKEHLKARVMKANKASKIKDIR